MARPRLALGLRTDKFRPLTLAVRKGQRIILVWPSVRTAGYLPLLLLDSAPTAAGRSPNRLSQAKSGNSQLFSSRTSWARRSSPAPRTPSERAPYLIGATTQ